MENSASSLQVVRHRRTGAVLFFKKVNPPFKNHPPLEFPYQNNSPFEEKVAKNLQLKNNTPIENYEITESVADEERVLFDFGNEYGFWQVYVSML